MRTAKIHVDAIAISCPHCGEYVPNQRNHAFMFLAEDRQELIDRNWRKCTNCQRLMRLPVSVKKLGGLL